MPKIIEAEDTSPKPDFEPNHEVHVTTEGILKGFREINQTQEMRDFYDAVIPAVTGKTEG
ncbi:hypothetical protein FACS189460_1300 [Deltaproteobacteria bacterium]|nr:hypothetical protein FACS189460_1300 [Deltaproteobacteria bacterium]